jgi:hypothetical protein
MDEPRFLLFASDATWVGLIGAVLITVAYAAWLGERRRKRRKEPDAVGWVPWTTVSFVTFFCGAILLSLAVKGWLAP